MTPPRKPTPRESAALRRKDFDRELLARMVVASERQATALETLVLKATLAITVASEARAKIDSLELDNEKLVSTVEQQIEEIAKLKEAVS